MKLKPSVSVEIKKKRYTSEIPDILIEKEIGKANESGIMPEEGKAAVKHFREKYEQKQGSDETGSTQKKNQSSSVSSSLPDKKVKKDVSVSPDGV